MVMLKGMFTVPDNFRMFRKQFFDQCKFIGLEALPVICVISIFLGMVMTLQASYMLTNPDFPVINNWCIAQCLKKAKIRA